MSGRVVPCTHCVREGGRRSRARGLCACLRAERPVNLTVRVAMAEFGQLKRVGPPVAAPASAAAAPGGAAGSPETRRGGEPVSNGNCNPTDPAGRLHRGSSCESPTWEGLDSATKSLPRRSSLIKDGSRAGRERKKTVSFSSSLSEKKISSAADCIHSMVEGSELKKVRPNSRVYQRYYLLDAGLQALCWEPSKKESDKARIGLSSIREVRTGRNTEIFRTSGVYEQISEDCAFSIIYGELYESLDLVAHSTEVANIWVTGLRYLIQYGKNALDMLASRQHRLRLGWLEQLFSSAADSEIHKDIEQGICLQSAVKLIQMVNPGVSGAKVEQRFQELQRGRAEHLSLNNGSGAKDHTKVTATPGARNERVTQQEFIEVFHDFCTRPEIYFLLVQFSSNKEFLDTKDLMRFLEAEQGVAEVTEEDSLSLIQSHEPSEEGRQQGYLSMDGFSSYLISPECHLFDREHDIVCQDMSQPLSHYFINSSHNTYLIEDQYKGPSDISGYVRALKMGCRCVEVDVWDGSDEEPVVCTGHTLCPPLALRNVLEAIGRFAFVASEYPLIVCLENHCSLRQQKVLMQHLVKILGDQLFTRSPDERESYLPSPQALRRRILLKGKKLKVGWEAEDGEVSEEDEGAEMCPRMKTAANGGAAPGDSEKGKLQKSVPSAVATLCTLPHLPHKKFLLLKELSDLVTLCESVHFIDFPTSAKRQKPWQLCSFDETQAGRLACESPGDFVNHNKHFLSRVYPSPMRIDSSNMNPQDLWKCGCQIVSMNFQTAGLMMDLNAAWFRQNGNCGYVLRPAIMRQEVSYFSADTKDTVPGVSPQLLHVKVISGQNLPKPKGSVAKGDVVDPYVYVEIHGIPADCTERRTRTVSQNSDNPVFDESFEFQINLPELAMVRFVVLDDDFIGDEFIGQYTIPLECLQPGYRHVPLQSLTGEDLPHSKLFVHVALTNRRGGGKPHKRGLSVRKARRRRDYTALRDLEIRSVDEVFKMAGPLLRDATDLRENMQNSVATFRDLCGVSAASNLMQCILALGSRVRGPDGSPLLLFDLQTHYPTVEPQGPLPDVLRRVVSTYDTMVQASKAVLELSDGIYERILHIQTTAMTFHEHLQSLAAKEGLKGRKAGRAVESFTWNITILKGQADLLTHAKAEVQENAKQVRDAVLAGNLAREGQGVPRGRSQSRRSQHDNPAMSV
ncbi:inactive phospholipase C-like protein 2 isoform X3 [Syngnathoides biaculeatus]|uniref:inactive phospholipase C-like protein 2 isoform X3 n=1 Tax=Syngnathoides biaculeatus TaxID=300417 RepID=UPI002ADE72B9|nr:inactive phospholipase C-like protein 2 isoform X3 [Syngnathoides biaculeatus]